LLPLNVFHFNKSFKSCPYIISYNSLATLYGLSSSSFTDYFPKVFDSISIPFYYERLYFLVLYLLGVWYLETETAAYYKNGVIYPIGWGLMNLGGLPLFLFSGSLSSRFSYYSSFPILDKLLLNESSSAKSSSSETSLSTSSDSDSNSSSDSDYEYYSSSSGVSSSSSESTEYSSSSL